MCSVFGLARESGNLRWEWVWKLQNDITSRLVKEISWGSRRRKAQEVVQGWPAQRILTARAASRATVAKEISAWTIIIILAHRERTGQSVGEKAVLVLKARNR
jgi:hypothetical protein